MAGQIFEKEGYWEADDAIFDSEDALLEAADLVAEDEPLCGLAGSDE